VDKTEGGGGGKLPEGALNTMVAVQRKLADKRPADQGRARRRELACRLTGGACRLTGGRDTEGDRHAESLQALVLV
jgi:hypothetical protein